MTAINNLRGYIVKDGRVIYSEKVEDAVIFVVIEKYLPFIDEKNFVTSSVVWLEAAVTTGEEHRWTNGVLSLKENMRQEIAPFPELRTLVSKDGYRLWEHAHSHYPLNGTPSRRVMWLVEVPKEELIKFAK